MTVSNQDSHKILSTKELINGLSRAPSHHHTIKTQVLWLYIYMSHIYILFLCIYNIYVPKVYTYSLIHYTSQNNKHIIIIFLIL